MLGDKLTQKNSNTTPNPPRLRRSITPNTSSLTPIISPGASTSTLADDDCGSAHSHKRCSCFRRPRPPPVLESTSPLPARRALKKKTSTTSMYSNNNYSSSPAPSTPDRPRNGRKKSYNFDDSTYSTTPAGPPPTTSSTESSTPAGPPPPSFLGSSMIPQPAFGSTRSESSARPLQFGTPVGQTPQLPKMKPVSAFPAFNKPVHGIFSSPSAKRYNQQMKEPSLGRSGLNQNAPALKPNNFFQPPPEEDEDEMEEDDESYDSRSPGRDDFNHDGEQEDESMDGVMTEFRQSMMAGDGLMVEGDYDEIDDFQELARLEKEAIGNTMDDDGDSDLLLPTPGRPRGDRSENVRFGDTMRDDEKDMNYENIARDLYKDAATPNIHETDDLVLETEESVMKIYDVLRNGSSDTRDEDLSRVLNEVSQKLVALWDQEQYMSTPSATEEYDLGIGPDPELSALANANFLGGLLLQLHKPPMPSTNTLGVSRMSFRASFQPQAAPKDTSLPATLVAWINHNHNPLPSFLNDLHRYQPAPSASRTFWKDLQSGLLRGKVPDVAHILRDAGWESARGTGNESLRGSTGFHGPALNNIEKEVKALINLLEEYCPGYNGDWNIHSSDWKMFRLRADNEAVRLREFAEGKNEHSEFGFNSTHGESHFTLQSRIARSKVPWPVYQNLQVLYEIFSGSPKAIAEAAADWCEATVGLMLWWDEGKEDNRVVLGRSHFGGVGGDPGNYLRKLKRSVRRAVDNSAGIQVNTANPIEVGLVSAFRGDIEAVIGLMRIWSLPLSAAVAEIAALGGWLPRTAPLSLMAMQEFEAEEMNLLGLTGPNDRNDGIKDHTLNIYASALAAHHSLETQRAEVKIVRDSWELAIAVLGRLDSASRSEESVGQLLEIIPIDSHETLDKLIYLLNHIGLAPLARKQAEKHADVITESTQHFGESLWYYARAHNPHKVKEVLSLLFSYSLIESRAVPTFENLDPYLVRLISDKKAMLEELEEVDMEASQLIQRFLSGYAVLRQYYEARDEQVLGLQKTGKWQGTKNKAALQRLITLINSSADNIRGGLYDESCGAVIPVEFLIPLVGEALPFISQPGTESIITIQHIEVLLRSIEDLQTVSSRVYNSCNDFFKTVLASASGLKGSSPADLLARSTTSGMSQSQFSLAGSSYVAAQLKKSMSGSGLLGGSTEVIKRAWDWRKGLSSTTTAEEVLSMVRLGLAKDLARCWIDEADGNF